MKKRLTVILLATLMLTAVLGATAYAASAQDIVNAANASISQEIAQATAQADQATAVYNTSIAAVNACSGPDAAMLLDLCRTMYDARLDQISASLISRTDQISKQAIASCAALGVKVMCQYTPVTLGDRVVLVDPLVIIG